MKIGGRFILKWGKRALVHDKALMHTSWIEDLSWSTENNHGLSFSLSDGKNPGKYINIVEKLSNSRQSDGEATISPYIKATLKIFWPVFPILLSVCFSKTNKDGKKEAFGRLVHQITFEK